MPEVRLYLATEVTPLWEATETQLARAGVPPPYWAFAWAGGQILARHLLDHPEIVAGRRVLDLASGSGLVAIAAALAGAAEVTAVDVDPFAGAAIALNAALNRVVIEVRIEDLTGAGAGAGGITGRRGGGEARAEAEAEAGAGAEAEGETARAQGAQGGEGGGAGARAAAAGELVWTMSAGIAVWVPPSGDGPEDVVRRAGEALAAARAKGPSSILVDTGGGRWKDGMSES